MSYEPAFPTNSDNYAPNWSDPGMSLRDYFAAKAMMIDYNLAKDFSDPDWRVGIAKDAYKMADAMLEARKETQ